MKVKDLEKVINPKLTKVIYENHWTGVVYEYVDGDTQIELILPFDDKSIKVSVTI